MTIKSQIWFPVGEKTIHWFKSDREKENGLKS